MRVDVQAGSVELVERFMQHVEPEPMSGCWLWSGAVGKNGYGYFAPTSKDVRLAHRYAYELFRSLPKQHIDHKCRVRLCVNPDHLEDVSQAENNRRAAAVRTTCRRGHLLTDTRTHYGRQHRWCRTCHNEARRAA